MPVARGQMTWLRSILFTPSDSRLQLMATGSLVSHKSSRCRPLVTKDSDATNKAQGPGVALQDLTPI